MTEVLFYHLQNMLLENVLPPLLEKSLERGWRVVVQSTSQERTDALDAHLWTYRDDSFLPHATWRAADAQDQPIVLAAEEGNPNRANVRFLIDNAGLPEDADAYDRVVLVFNGDDGDALVALLASPFTERVHGLGTRPSGADHIGIFADLALGQVVGGRNRRDVDRLLAGGDRSDRVSARGEHAADERRRQRVQDLQDDAGRGIQHEEDEKHADDGDAAEDQDQKDRPRCPADGRDR